MQSTISREQAHKNRSIFIDKSNKKNAEGKKKHDAVVSKFWDKQSERLEEPIWKMYKEFDTQIDGPITTVGRSTGPHGGSRPHFMYRLHSFKHYRFVHKMSIVQALRYIFYPLKPLYPYG